MSKYKTFKKEKWLYLICSIFAYFLPFIIVTACLFPLITSAGDGFKLAIGMAVILINTLPFLQGLLESFVAHFPMLNIPAFIYILISTFFTLDIFQEYRGYFNWIELAAVIGSVVSCILWGKYRKYSHYNKTMGATIKSGAFVTKP